MERDIRRKRQRLLGILGALWLVVGCLGGCKAAPPQGAQTRTQVVSETEASSSGTKAHDAGEEGKADSEAASQGREEGLSAAAQEQEAGPSAASQEQEESSAAAQEQKEALGDAGQKQEEAQSPVSQKQQAETAFAEEAHKTEPVSGREEDTQPALEESGSYTSRDEVALYLHLYGHLPDNYITKKEAEELGWSSREGNLWEVAPGMSIGGSRFGNYEGALPDKKGRKYYECDIDFEGGYRGAKRIIYSDDGLIFYTEDHYKTFEQLYGQ